MENNKRVDLHLHTIVSDGEVTPRDILQCAKELSLDEISITDHDAIGAYVNFGEDLFKSARDMGFVLTSGIELDSHYADIEVHVLAYGFDIHHQELHDYLANIHSLRKQRVIEQIEQINRAFDCQMITASEVLIPLRDTVMKPHLIRPLLEKGKFTDYREASRWLGDNTKPATSVPKPSTAEIVSMIKRIGGQAFLAHPGYYIIESGIDIDKMITDLLPHGLVGVEVDYPYYKTAPKFQTPESETQIVDLLHQAALKFSLKTSRGSDAHQLGQMRTFNYPIQSVFS